jgi:hypothetical protein
MHQKIKGLKFVGTGIRDRSSCRDRDTGIFSGIYPKAKIVKNGAIWGQKRSKELGTDRYNNLFGKICSFLPWTLIGKIFRFFLPDIEIF